jgi:hypothetical protein
MNMALNISPANVHVPMPIPINLHNMSTRANAQAVKSRAFYASHVVVCTALLRSIVLWHSTSSLHCVGDTEHLDVLESARFCCGMLHCVVLPQISHSYTR